MDVAGKAAGEEIGAIWGGSEGSDGFREGEVVEDG